MEKIPFRTRPQIHLYGVKNTACIAGKVNRLERNCNISKEKLKVFIWDNFPISLKIKTVTLVTKNLLMSMIWTIIYHSTVTTVTKKYK